MVKKRQNRRQKKTKQDQYDTAAYVFTFVWIPSGTTFCSETPVAAKIQRPERTQKREEKSREQYTSVISR